MYHAIELFFQVPLLSMGEEERLSYTRQGKAHGRLETRTIATSALLNPYLDWPGVQHVMQRTYQAVTGARARSIAKSLTASPA